MPIRHRQTRMGFLRDTIFGFQWRMPQWAKLPAAVMMA
jgi:hypothetical protein